VLPRALSLPLKFGATLMLEREEPGAVAPGIAANAPVQGSRAAHILSLVSLARAASFTLAGEAGQWLAKCRASISGV
jgi:hypothetical protein